MIEVDGSRYSGSGTIVRQAVSLAALTGQSVRIVNARVKRPNPGLRPQHVRAIEAVLDLVGGTSEGVREGSKEIIFRPGKSRLREAYTWDIGSAGSTTLLLLAVLPLLVFGRVPLRVEVRGGLFQDFAPSYHHLQHVSLFLFGRMGVGGEVEMVRPGYVPKGGGVLRFTSRPVHGTLQPLILDNPGPVRRVWGIAFTSHLEERRVGHRMEKAAKAVLEATGQSVDISIRSDDSSLQPGASLALFSDLEGDLRLGADGAGAPGRPAEVVGRRVARRLLEDLDTGAALDRHAADQIIPFAALAQGRSTFRIPRVTEHIESSAWLAEKLLGAKVEIQSDLLVVDGVGFRGKVDPP